MASETRAAVLLEEAEAAVRGVDLGHRARSLGEREIQQLWRREYLTV